MGRIPMRFAGSLTYRVILPYRGTRKRLQTLTLHVGPGDDGHLDLHPG